ncbi:MULTISPECIES: hypothetical protein [unclassified Streptosporangium]|uniref:hypothetical protein n=1 Tax=unclassified Streptosporangium TaxID=2632669 RepID=UPI002E2C3B1D|nr:MULTISPECIES: hypothetical protein [unclassified Streptosporangium]
MTASAVADESIRYFTPTSADLAFVDPGRGWRSVGRLGVPVAPYAAVARVRARRCGLGAAGFPAQVARRSANQGPERREERRFPIPSAFVARAAVDAAVDTPFGKRP